MNTNPDIISYQLRKHLFSGEYEKTEAQLLKNTLTRDSVVLEIGTGIGFISILSRKICTNGRVASYEANPQTEEIIRGNYRLNNLEPELHMMAVTTHGEDIPFFVDSDIISSSLIDRARGDQKITVPSVKIADILKELKPDTIIMDVEGAEVELLNSTNLDGIANIVLELHPHIVGQALINKLFNTLKEKGLNPKSSIGKVCLFQRG